MLRTLCPGLFPPIDSSGQGWEAVCSTTLDDVRRDHRLSGS